VSEDDSRHSDRYIKRGRDCDNDWNIRWIRGLRTHVTCLIYANDVPFHYAENVTVPSFTFVFPLDSLIVRAHVLISRVSPINYISRDLFLEANLIRRQ